MRMRMRVEEFPARVINNPTTNKAEAYTARKSSANTIIFIESNNIKIEIIKHPKTRALVRFSLATDIDIQRQKGGVGIARQTSKAYISYKTTN